MTVVRRDPAFRNWRPAPPASPGPRQQPEVLPAAAGRLLVSAAALRPADVYLVVRPGRIAEAEITDLFVPQRFPSCRAGYRVTGGQAEPFWIGAGTLMVITRRDPAYENWSPDPAGRPAPVDGNAPEDALAFDPEWFCRAFRAHGIAGSYVTGTWETRAGRTDIALLHAEHPATIACWDLPGRFPHLGYDELPVHLPHLVVAQTACMAEDLGQPDDVDGWSAAHRRSAETTSGSLAGRYVCRLGHVHSGQSPYGRKLPPEAAARISASLGEEPRVISRHGGGMAVPRQRSA